MRIILALLLAYGACHQVLAEVAFEWMTVANAGNSADAHTGDGRVDYVFQISIFEVTNAQYAEFLTAVLPEGNVVFPTSDQAEQAVLWAQESIDQLGAQGQFSYQPVVGRELYPASMTFLDSMRFVNWLENGQPNGVPSNVTTEAGTYNVSEGVTEVRSASATYAIPTWDEWYKAAYHDPSKSGSQYWLYPNGSDTPPVSEASPGGPNSINLGRLEPVGSYPDAKGFYAAFDQAGSVGEWTEELVVTGSIVERRFGQVGTSLSEDSSVLYTREPHFYQGLRVVRLIPEPSSIALASFSLIVIGLLRRRR